MHRTAFDIHIEVQPGKVWDLITRFDAYPSWTRWAVMSGQLTVGGALDCRVFLRKRKGGSRPVTLPTEIVEVASGHRFAWAMGFAGLRFVQDFEVKAEGRGTRLIHAIEVHGPFSGLLGPRMAIMARRPSEGLLEDAKRRLEGGVRPKPVMPPKPKTPRYLPRPVRRGRR